MGKRGYKPRFNDEFHVELRRRVAISRARKKPVAFFKQKDKTGRTVTHPVFQPQGRTYEEPPMKVYQVRSPLWARLEEKRRKDEEERKKRLAEEEALRQKTEDIRRLLQESHSDDEVKKAMAKAELKRKYPDEYEHLLGEKAPQKEEPKPTSVLNLPPIKKKHDYKVAYMPSLGEKEEEKAQSEEERVPVLVLDESEEEVEGEGGD